VIHLSEKDSPPAIQGKIGDKEFKSDTRAFVEIKKNENGTSTAKDER
jgi:hypothetical protein